MTAFAFLVLLTLLVLGCSKKSPVAPEEPFTEVERTLVGEYVGIIMTNSVLMDGWQQRPLIKDIEFVFEDSSYRWNTDSLWMYERFIQSHGSGTWIQEADSALLKQHKFRFDTNYVADLEGWLHVEWVSDTLKLAQASDGGRWVHIDLVRIEEDSYEEDCFSNMTLGEIITLSAEDFCHRRMLSDFE